MDTDAVQFNASGPRLLSTREQLWNELERLNEQLGLDPPTATYTVEELAVEVALARLVHTAPALRSRLIAALANSAPTPIESADAPDVAALRTTLTQGNAQLVADPAATPRGGHSLRHRTWYTFYAPLVIGERA